MSRSPVKIHVAPNVVAPAPALTSSVDHKSELFLVCLPLFPSFNKLVLHHVCFCSTLVITFSGKSTLYIIIIP